MPISPSTIADTIKAERKRQGLSREQLSGICGVSTSFIRDAESDAAQCTLGRLTQLIEALGMQLDISGLQNAALPKSPAMVNAGDAP